MVMLKLWSQIFFLNGEDSYPPTETIPHSLEFKSVFSYLKGNAPKISATLLVKCNINDYILELRSRFIFCVGKEEIAIFFFYRCQ